MKLELDAPNVGELEKEYLNKTIDSGFISTFGPNVPKFEEIFADYVNMKRAVSTQSGTAALHVALHELGIGKDDEVIVPALTFIATINPVVYVGAQPVFVDVDIETWNIDPYKIEESITKKTRAILPVHLYGNPCTMGSLMDIAKKHNLYVIEDTTESLGAMYNGKHTGTFGDLGCFSFNGNKTITTGSGGMITGNNNQRMDHIKFLVNQARDSDRGYFHPEIGFNYRMTNISASMGLAQMERLDGLLERKKRLHAVYKEELGGVDHISFQKEYDGAESSWWFTCVNFKEYIDVVTLQSRLKEKGVPVRRIFMPLVEFPPYEKCRLREYENSYRIYERGLCLPSSTLNSTEDISFVCRMIIESLEEQKR